MFSTAFMAILLSSVVLSSHFDEDYEEHKSGYGYSDRKADFGHDNSWLGESHRHSADSHLAQGAEHHKSAEKFEDSGAKKHSDESLNRGKDSKQRNYGFYDYQFVEPQYHLEKFYTNEQRSRKFDEGERNHAAARHNDNKEHSANADQHHYRSNNAQSAGNKLDRSESGQHGHKDSLDEHYNQLDKSSHVSESNTGPFKNNQYVPLFSPY